jgi:hypothetical protein
MSYIPGPTGDVPTACEQCGAVTLVASSRISGRVSECMHCWSIGRMVRDAAGRFQAFTAGMSRIRLYWYQGYVSDGSDELSTLDAQAVTLSPDGQRVTLHATGGGMHYFNDSGMVDRDGIRIFRERPFWEYPADHGPPAPTRPLLAPSDTFDYAVSIPPAGEEGVCGRRQMEPTRSDNHSRCLLGSSPRLHIAPVGLLSGGGPLSPLCDLIRPTILGSRVTLSSEGAPDATAARASFLLSGSGRLLSGWRPTPPDIDAARRAGSVAVSWREFDGGPGCGHRRPPWRPARRRSARPPVHERSASGCLELEAARAVPAGSHVARRPAEEA